MTRTILRTAPLLLLFAGVTACDREGAYGDANSIVVGTTAALWTDIEDDVETILEPTIRTVRDEKTFTVTWQDPTETEWGNLRKFQQLLLVGFESDPWVAAALEKVDGRVGFAPPEVVQVYNVWARGQTVTILLLDPDAPLEGIEARLAELQRMYDRQYREYARNRMFLTGADTALADTLRREAGFSLLVPMVYRWGVEDSTYVFVNDNPDPSELIRQISVTWQSPIPEGLGGEDLLDWRQATSDTYYDFPQVTDLTDVQAGPFDFEGLQAYQIQAVWQNAPEANWPAAGPFILRGIVCPAQNRMYLVDAWLYAPGKEKYEYMLQLEYILDSFSCTTAP